MVYTAMRGRDGFPVSPSQIPRWRALEMRNVDLYRAAFARKRGGSVNLFTDTTSEAFTGALSFLGEHLPTSDPTASELWGVDNAATPVVQRLAGGTAWATPSLKDNLQGNAQDVMGVSFNGKYYVACNTAVDRLHLWDGATVRRAGMATPAAPTGGNTGSGSYTATARTYRLCWAVLSGSTVVRRSEHGGALTATPSGSGTAYRVTIPSVAGEGETHWILEGSVDGSVFYDLATTAIASATYDDSAEPSTYPGREASPLAGTHTNWTSAKFLMVANGHLIGAGAWESSGARYSRVWWSGVTNQTTSGGSPVTAYDETVIQNVNVSNYADLDELSGGGITGVGGPLDNRPVIFKRNQVWRLVPTGIDTPFYIPREVFPGSSVGCIRQQTIVNAEDAAGRAAVYWLSEDGPYRLGAEGPQCLVDDIQDLWDTINLDASTVVAHGTYYKALRQIWWYIAVGSGNVPSIKLVFDVRLGRVYEDGRVRDGWTVHDGASAAALCSCQFAATPAASMSRLRKPYVGLTTGTVILKCDTAATDDNGTDFQGYVDLPDTHYGGWDHKHSVGRPVVVGSAGAYSLAATLTADYGREARGPATVSMAATGSETRAARLIEGVEEADANATRVRIGDSAASDAVWTIDAVVIQVEQREAL